MKHNFYKLLFLFFSFFLLSSCSLAEEKETNKNQIENVKHSYKTKHVTENKDTKTITKEKVPLNLSVKEYKNNVQSRKKTIHAKGIYISSSSLKKGNIDPFISLLNRTNLNSLVIDMKDDKGYLMYNSKIKLVNDIQSDKHAVINNLSLFIHKLKSQQIYLIARVVVFKDPYLAEHVPSISLHDKQRRSWRDDNGLMWVDPYNQKVWQYNSDIANELFSLGFDEIQFDYVRFPDNEKKVNQEVLFDNETKTKEQNIGDFLRFVRKNEVDNMVLSADVFGLVTTSKDDMGIGQLWEEISPNVDYISPMTYPSHYDPYSYGVAEPEKHPYEILSKAMEDAIKRNRALQQRGLKTAVIRPWIQDFDFKHDYNEKDIRNQIQAIVEKGIDGYLVWNASNRYTESAYK